MKITLSTAWRWHLLIVVTIYVMLECVHGMYNVHHMLMKSHQTVGRHEQGSLHGLSGAETLIRNHAKTKSVFAFAKHFQDHMVLQQAPRKANIYGFSSDIGQKVIMEIITNKGQWDYTTKVKPGPTPDLGVWSFTLDPMTSDVKATIKVEAEAGGLQLNDVLFGDVWICSGQSNMQFTVSQMYGAAEEIKNAGKFSDVRLVTVAENSSPTPLYDVVSLQENWSLASNVSIGGAAWSYFSAMCWLYGKALYQKLGYPIGMVATDWGGTPVEAWSSPEALASCNVTGQEPLQEQTGGVDSTKFNLHGRQSPSLSEKIVEKLQGPSGNSVLWNAMIHPLLGMTIYGAIWYQGENDASSAEKMNRYNCTFPAMIADWRTNFHKASNQQTDAQFPFGFVQLAGYRPDPNINVGFPDIRWHQTADYGFVPNRKMPRVFMAVAMDLPDFTSIYGSIHPRDKLDIGDRLTLSGMYVAYNKVNIFEGPFPKHANVSGKSNLVIDYGTGWKLEVRSWTGFELACTLTTGISRWVQTGIVTNSSTTVTVFLGVCTTTEHVTGLRYAWRESPCSFKQCAVYESSEGLPAPPFIAYASTTANRAPVFTFGGPVHI